MHKLHKLHKLPVIPIPDHLHEFLIEMKRKHSKTYRASVIDALQKEYDRHEKLKKRAK